ncbi:hypothetical protein [Futiania mangrovi]|uniref:Uncharacterized protein n=1 Tax=Futiania mangrovi TaxID=2959716 RepID=A0A9J6PH87_9PROT|nr:hypothetical protein [Futiania mangrovii]MCP1337171.1 hypothetical protein [Futiania mangrovii]
MLARHIESRAQSHRLLAEPDVARHRDVRAAADQLVARLRETDAETLPDLVSEGTISPGRIHLGIDRQKFARFLGTTPEDIDPECIQLSSPFTIRRRGVETRIVAGERARQPDARLVRMLAKAHRWVGEARSGTPFAVIARREKHADAYIRVRAQLAFLSPRIQAAILDGTQPPDLCLERFVRTLIPLDWAEQERLFGFTA